MESTRLLLTEEIFKYFLNLSPLDYSPVVRRRRRRGRVTRSRQISVAPAVRSNPLCHALASAPASNRLSAAVSQNRKALNEKNGLGNFSSFSSGYV